MQGLDLIEGLESYGWRLVTLFRGDQIHYDYTVEVTNRFKGLDMIGGLKDYGWRFMTLSRRQGSRPSTKKTNAKGK